jgi:hypothetical protein
MKNFIIFILFIFLAVHSYSQTGRNILQNKAQETGLGELIKKPVHLENFPGYNDRNFWNSLPENISTQYINEAEKVLDFSWPAIKATDYLEILRTGQRLHDQFVLPHDVLRALIMGELTEGKGRFLDQIVNGVWYYSEQTWWGWSAHLKDQKEADGLPDVNEPILDLGAGEIVNTLSMSYLLFKDEFDQIHPFIAKRLKQEVMNKVIIPYYERDDFWWMGFKEWYDPYADSPRRLNNWNTWINYNMLLAILVFEDNPDQRAMGVNKVLRSIDNLLNSYPDDGGCDEGPSYWKKAGGHLYLTLNLLDNATDGRFNIFDNQLIKNMGTYIYKASIDYPYFLNFADADATESIFPEVIYLYGKDIQNTNLQNFGAWVARKEGWGTKVPQGNIDRIILQLLHFDEILKAQATDPLVADFWLPDTQLAGARDMAGSTDGFYFAAKGGYNDESHNHNDAGTFIMYYNGKPCLIDIGRETYTAKTFGPNRYDIWNMQSQYHNLPRINGHDQAFGPQYKAQNTSFRANGKKAVFSADIAGAYPEEAKIISWNRTYTLNRGKSFIIQDGFRLSEIKEGPTSLHFITYCRTELLKEGVLKLSGDDFILYLHYDEKQLIPTIEFIAVTDPRLANFWPKGISRLVFTFKNQVHSGNNLIEIKNKP